MPTQQQTEPDLAKLAVELAERRTQSPAASDTCQPIARDLDAMVARLRSDSKGTRIYIDPAEREAAQRRTQAAQRWAAIQASIGARYAMSTFEGYEVYHADQRPALEAVKQYAANLPAHVARGDGLILYGPCGTGKDHLLNCVLREAALTHGLPVSHVYGLDLHAQVREAMDDERVEKALKSYRDAQVLAISDPIPNAGTLTDWQRQTMMRLVNTRYVSMRTTMLTINAPSLDPGVDPKTQVNVWNELTDAVFDRLTEGAVMVPCFWPSYRQRGAK